ncbi:MULTISPECIES: DUF192 domain-containing protein [unclassified Streptomyces]|uniref:DUF192 domain-containing protein n=1 Tax=unclassified Streptomyces TaxID=2593676 RepID=UPI00224E4E0B|nr:MULTISPECIES: DUF192 domain-containing protein [unclassified Streptomyces]MCX4527803.1 DUF192 domain-containing protein [Streptomyces sp. NBC_01551]MCX4541600.1 DUF192 domain-containing protein [Streptomyces sp. NBC_01565]
MRRHPYRRWRDGEAVLRVGVGDPAATVEAAEAAEAPLEVPLEIAASYRARTRGLLGRDGVEGALLLTPAASVHTIRMRFAIDVAYLDRNLRVIALTTMAPGRLGLPRPRSRHVLEAAAGAMAGWGLRIGTALAVQTPPRPGRG